MALPAPAMNAGFFAFTTAAAELRAGRRGAAVGAAVAEKLRARWLSAVVVSTQLWSIVNYANFALVPHEFRVVVGGGAALLWNVYLSVQQNRTAAGGATRLVPFFLWAPEVEWPEGSWPRIAADGAPPGRPPGQPLR